MLIMKGLSLEESQALNCTYEFVQEEFEKSNKETKYS